MSYPKEPNLADLFGPALRKPRRELTVDNVQLLAVVVTCLSAFLAFIGSLVTILYVVWHFITKLW